MYKVEYLSKKNFELPTRSSVPGLTAIQDSEWLALKGPDRHVAASGTREPGGTGSPPPVVGELATTLVNGALALQEAPPTPLATGMAPSTSTAAPNAASTPGSLLIISPPLARFASARSTTAARRLPGVASTPALSAYCPQGRRKSKSPSDTNHPDTSASPPPWRSEQRRQQVLFAAAGARGCAEETLRSLSASERGSLPASCQRGPQPLPNGSSTPTRHESASFDGLQATLRGLRRREWTRSQGAESTVQPSQAAPLEQQFTHVERRHHRTAATQTGMNCDETPALHDLRAAVDNQRAAGIGRRF